MQDSTKRIEPMGPADTSITDPIRCARACAHARLCEAASLLPGRHCTLGILLAGETKADLHKPAQDELYVLMANGGKDDSGISVESKKTG